MIDHKYWLGWTLLVGLFTGYTGCQQPTTKPLTQWPEPPLTLALDRNWTTLDMKGSEVQIPVVGDVALTRGRDIGDEINTADLPHVRGVSLTTGKTLWTLALQWGTDWAYFTDGDYLYIDYTLDGPENPNNHLYRFTSDGQMSSVYYVIPGYEQDYKNPILNTLSIEYFDPAFYHVDDKIMYFSVGGPSLRSGIAAPPTGGGLYALDFTKVQPTATEGEYTVTLRKVFDRTNPNTRYDQPLVFTDAQGTKLLLFAEVFQKVAQFPPLDFQRYPDLDFCSANVGVHLVEEATGVERWKFVDPWVHEYATLALWKDKAFVTGYYRGSLVNISDGSLVWQPAFDIKTWPASSTPYSHVIVGDVAYLNRDHANNPTSLQALDLNTGKPIWTAYQQNSEGYGIFHKDGVLWVINQDGIRLYRASDGKYLAYDGSLTPAQDWSYPNHNFIHNGNLIVIGGDQTVSLKMNYALDGAGNLVKTE